MSAQDDILAGLLTRKRDPLDWARKIAANPEAYPLISRIWAKQALDSVAPRSEETLQERDFVAAEASKPEEPAW